MMQRQFVALNGLRGVAAVVIFTSHLPDPTYEQLLPAHYLGVDFFFVLSGFVLAHAYGERLRTAMGFTEFMVRRYIRLWPFYLLGSLMGLTVALRDHWPVSSIAIAAAFAILFVPKPTMDLSSGQHPTFPLNSPAWSLFFELVANAVYGAIARFLSWRVLGGLLAVGAALLIATRVYYGDLNVGSTLHSLPGGLGRVMWSFFAGVAVYRLWQLRPGPAFSSLICVALLIAMMAIPLAMLWVLLGFPLLVYLAANAEPKGWLVPVFSRLGVISYGLYAIHQPIILQIQDLVPLSTPWAVLALLGVLCGLVLVLDRWFDAPVRRWLEKLALPPLGAWREARLERRHSEALPAGREP